MNILPEVRVGDPACHQSLTVFPLFMSVGQSVDYLLADEAIGSGAVAVEELHESGSVPELMVSNTGDSRVLFLEGEELRGAKQNRVLNTSVLVPARSKTKIPVSCVEQGRWRYKSRHFSSEGSHSSPKLRGALKQSVSWNLKAGGTHLSDQGAVWAEVGRQMRSLGAHSATHAMEDTYKSYSDRLAEFQKALPYVEGATGMAVAVGSKVVAVDLFDKPETTQKAWGRLLTGVAMDSLETPAAANPPTADDVSGLIARLRDSTWQQSPAVGEGQEFRSDADDLTHASALLFQDSVLHGSVVVAS